MFLTNIHTDSWTKQELIDAMPPITSILHKCQKAQEKHDCSSLFYKQMETMIHTMQISAFYLEQAINQ